MNASQQITALKQQVNCRLTELAITAAVTPTRLGKLRDHYELLSRAPLGDPLHAWTILLHSTLLISTTPPPVSQ